MAAEETLSLEIDSPDAPGQTEPGNVPARSALELAAAYVDLLEKLAKEKGASLTFRGIEVHNKCVEFRFRVNDVGLAEAAAIEASRYLQGVLVPPRSLRKPVERLRKEVERQASAGRKVRASAGKWNQPLSVAEPQPSLLPSATVTFRARLIRAGGKDPGVRFETQEGDFSLDATEALAAAIAHHLYLQLDVTARIHRTPEGRIDGGSLVEFHPVANLPAKAWLEWLETAGRGWTTLDKALEDLGRD